MTTKLTGQVVENIQRLQHYQNLEIQLARLLGGWLPGIALWEAKQQIGAHLWEDAEHSRELRTRLWELRVAQPDRGVTEHVLPFVQAIAEAQHDYELLAGVYGVVKDELLAAYQNYLAETPAIYDGPSVPMVRRLIMNTEAQIAWAQTIISQLASSATQQREIARWTRYVRELLAASGGVSGSQETATSCPVPPPGYALRLPFPTAFRDERFMLAASGAERPTTDDHDALVRWQFGNYLQEMQAAETLGSILWEVEGMPWEFYYDLARHCSDEVRHARLGETRMAQLGYHPWDVPQYVGNYVWRQEVDPTRRYCVLTYIIESDAFALKYSTNQDHLRHGDAESAQAVQFDILDETMHVRFGHKWVPALMQHDGLTQSLEELVAECRALNNERTLAPAQRQAH